MFRTVELLMQTPTFNNPFKKNKSNNSIEVQGFGLSKCGATGI